MNMAMKLELKSDPDTQLKIAKAYEVLAQHYRECAEAQEQAARRNSLQRYDLHHRNGIEAHPVGAFVYYSDYMREAASLERRLDGVLTELSNEAQAIEDRYSTDEVHGNLDEMELEAETIWRCVRKIRAAVSEQSQSSTPSAQQVNVSEPY